MSTVEILYICVNYHSEDDTKRLIELLCQQTEFDKVACVVVNGSAGSDDDATFRELETKFLNVKLINASHNPGYFGGAQLALESFCQDSEMPEWIILSNTDIEIEDKKFCEKLINYKRKEDVVQLAPQIISSISQSDQNPFMMNRPSPYRMHFYKWIFHYSLLCQLYQMLGLLKAKFKSLANGFSRQIIAPQEIYSGHGAFLIFHKEFFLNGGSFKHPTFLYNEEIFVAEKINEKGLKVFYDPAFRIWHNEHGTIGLLPSKRILKCMAESSRFVADRYFKI